MRKWPVVLAFLLVASACGGLSGADTPANPGNSKNCSDFSTYEQAKTWFDTYYPNFGDVAKLDRDGGMIPCESLRGSSTSSYSSNSSGRSYTAICRDGTLSYSKNRQGTCSHHGGVKSWG